LTRVYFVRHAQPEHSWEDDRTRPLTKEGLADAEQVKILFTDISIHHFYSSPYRRSLDTIRPSATATKKEIITDERLRERQKGQGGNEYGMFEKRWANFDYHEENGESLANTQSRNIAALSDILRRHPNTNLAVGTHGTALSTILRYYDSSYGCQNFLRIIDFMPYVIRLDFEGLACVAQEELLIVRKEFKGRKRADRQ